MNEFRDDIGDYCCPQCGFGELTVDHTFTLIRTWETWIPCLCESQKEEGAAKQLYKSSEVRWELGFLEDGRSKVFDRGLIDRLPVEDLEDECFCQDCLEDASENDWQHEEVEEADIVDGPGAWKLFCSRCKQEYPFGWTEPDRQDLIVPLTEEDTEPVGLWVDPGFQFRQRLQER